MEFPCRECGAGVVWMTAKSGKKYLAQPKEWYGDQYGAHRVFYPAHHCTPDPAYKAVRAAEEAARAEAKAAKEAKAAALAEAGVKVPSGRTTVTGTVVSVKVEDDAFGYGVTFKMLVESDEGWKVWGTVPMAFRGDVEPGFVVTFSAEVQPSDKDALFGFFKRPTKAAVVKAA